MINQIMKKQLFPLILCLSLFMLNVDAQVRTPAPSPFQKVEQAVGLTNITIEYSRPSMKGRTIFGDLVPYDQIWRTGANLATKITFGEDVTVGGESLKGGAYAVLTKPGMNSWDVMFYEFDGAGFGGYVEKEPTATVTANVEKTDNTVESFTIGVDHLRNESAHLVFSWENTAVKVPVELNTDAAVMASIERTMAGPSANDYSAAANYYLSAGKDLDKALMWINKSLESNPDRYWVVRTKAEIQAKLGDYKGAIETAKQSMALATEAGNQDYVKINKENIDKWMKM